VVLAVTASHWQAVEVAGGGLRACRRPSIEGPFELRTGGMNVAGGRAYQAATRRDLAALGVVRTRMRAWTAMASELV